MKVTVEEEKLQERMQERQQEAETRMTIRQMVDRAKYDEYTGDMEKAQENEVLIIEDKDKAAAWRIDRHQYLWMLKKLLIPDETHWKRRKNVPVEQIVQEYRLIYEKLVAAKCAPKISKGRWKAKTMS